MTDDINAKAEYLLGIMDETIVAQERTAYALERIANQLESWSRTVSLDGMDACLRISDAG